MVSVRSRHVALALLGSILLVPSAEGQSTSVKGASDVTRAQLTERARVADSLGRKEEAFQIRARLRDGDFDVGDRILLSIEGVGLRQSDTLIVQAARMVRLGGQLGDMSVAGVLRFEVGDSISARVAKYFKNEVVHVTPLIRLSLAGAVRIPGFYHVRPDAPLTDVIMKSGGQDPSADLRQVTIMRGTRIQWAKEDVQSALTEGLTVQQLDLESGDQVVVGTQRRNQWLGTVLPIAVTSLAAILVQALVRR